MALEKQRMKEGLNETPTAAFFDGEDENRRPAHPGERRAPEPQPPAASAQWLEPTVSCSAFLRKIQISPRMTEF